MRRLPLLLTLVLVLSCAWALPALAGSSDDQDIADSSVLTESDVTDDGLSEDAPSDDPPPSGAVCKTIRAAEKAADRAPNASTAFADTDGTVQVEDQVTVFKNAKAAKVAAAAYTGSKAAGCLEKVLEDGLQQNLPAGSSYEFNGNPEDIPIGDGGTVFQVLVTITDPDGAVTEQYVEVGTFRVGRGFVNMSVISTGEPFPASEDLATLIADNLDSNL
jgi:hypothetical protein